MGNILRGAKEEEGPELPYYQLPPQQHLRSNESPSMEQNVDQHQHPWNAVKALAWNFINSISTSMAGYRNTGHLHRSSTNRVVVPRYPCNTEDIDESSAEGLCSAESYVKANAMLIEVPVLGTTKTFWRLSDEATRINRKLALILRSHHSVGKYLTAPLQVTDVWIGSPGSVKLRGVSFTDQHFSIKRVQDDYKHLSRVLEELIHISGGDITKLPPDYKEFLALLRRDTYNERRILDCKQFCTAAHDKSH